MGVYDFDLLKFNEVLRRPATQHKLGLARIYTKLRGKTLKIFPSGSFSPSVAVHEKVVSIYCTLVWLQCATDKGVLNLLMREWKE